MNYQESIINLLLDKYEQSRHFRGEARVNRKVALRFNKRDYPLYDIESVEVKEAIHHAALTLQKRGLITVEWMKYETGNIMSRVFLNLKMLSEAYAFVHRKGKEEILGEMHRELEKLKGCVKTPWIKGFCASMLQEIEGKKGFPKYLPRDEGDFRLLPATLRGIEEKGEDELLERIFSRRFLGGSKEFERKMRSRLVTIVRNFLLNGRDMADEDVLEYIGLIKTSEDLSFCGPLTILLHGQRIDFSPFCYGASMNTEMIRNFEVAELPVRRVLTIENKAAYLEYIKKPAQAAAAFPESALKSTPDSTLTFPKETGQMGQELVVYLAGFYSPVKRLFLEKIYDYLREQSDPAPPWISDAFYHWGDLDAGGFQIFVHLKSLIPELRPLHMDTATLKENARFGDSFDDRYRKQLLRLLGQEDYAVFYDVINAMLQSGIRLEQEALAISP